MKFTQKNWDDGVCEQHFELTVDGHVVPGVLWLMEAARGPRPLLLIGHGGGQHKLFAPLAAGAKRYARDLGYAVVAIDAPRHGARTTVEDTAQLGQVLRQQMASANGVRGEALAMMMQIVEQAVPEWRAVIDALKRLDTVGGDGPVGYMGMSLGGMTGLALAAADARIKAAALGLVGLHAETKVLAQGATAVTAAVEFLMQWDDELVPRAHALALFDALGAAEKTLHANRGGHRDVPPFERAGQFPFFLRHLGQGALSS